MAKINVHVVPRSTFGSEGFDRLDAEYVAVQAMQLEDALLRLGGKRLYSYVQPYDGSAVNDKLMSAATKIGYVDIDAVDLTDGLIYVDYLKFSDRPSRAKYVLAEGDLLVSNVRPNRGAVAWVPANAEGALGSSGFTWLLPKQEQPVSSECLYLFLRTRHARAQLVRRTRGSMYPAVLSADVLNIVVPYIPDSLQRKFDNTVKRALKAQATFLEKLRAAEEYLNSLLEPFGAPPSPLASSREGIDITVIKHGDGFGSGGAGRIDAEFFRQEYSAFHATLRESGPCFKLGDYYDLQAGRIGSGDEMVPTFKQGCLTNCGINWTAVNDEPGATSTTNGLVHEGDILLAAAAHEIFYVGRKADVVRDMPPDVADYNQAVADLMIIRERPEKSGSIPANFTAAFLRHPAGLHQVQRCIRGLRGGHIYAQDLKEQVLIPNLGKSKLHTFDNIWTLAERTRAQARDLMMDATEKLEEWLDSAGADAMWLIDASSLL
jgi:hypothetical protein